MLYFISTTNPTMNKEQRIEQQQALQVASDVLLEDLKQLFTTKVLNGQVKQNEKGVQMYEDLMKFTYSEGHKTAGQFTKLIFEKTDVLKRFQLWLNENHYNLVGEKQLQKFFCRFYSHGHRHTKDEIFVCNVNWDYKSWRNHSPLETTYSYNRNKKYESHKTQSTYYKPRSPRS